MKRLMIASCLASLSVSALAAPAPAKANPFSYSYVEGQYVDVRDVGYGGDGRWKNGNADLDGFRINFSADVAKSFSIIGSVADLDGDIYARHPLKSDGRQDVDLTVMATGAAYHQALPQISGMPFDLVVRAQIEYVDYGAEESVYDDSETGILLGGGVQLAIFDKLQAFSDLNLSSNDYRGVTLSAGARYEFVPSLSAMAAIEVGDIEMFTTGLRFSF